MTQPKRRPAQSSTSSARAARRFSRRGHRDRQALHHRRPRRHAGGLDAGRRPHPARARARHAIARATRPCSAREPFKTGAASAALVNGTAGHALDWDDTQLATSADRIFGLLTHPDDAAARRRARGRRAQAHRRARNSSRRSSPASRSSARSPKRSTRITTRRASTRRAPSARSAPRSRRRSCSASTRPQIAHTLAIAASSASGIRVNFGSMTKPLHVGRAAQNGVMAAELAARGFTGGKDALDPPVGLLPDLQPRRRLRSRPHRRPARQPAHDRLARRVDQAVSVRRARPSDDGRDAPARRSTHDVQPEQIKAIRVRAGSNILNPLRYPIAKNELEAKFCPAFMVSAIALRRKAGIHEFNDEFVQSAPVQALMRKVERVLDPEIEAQGLGEDPQHRRGRSRRRPQARRARRRALPRRPGPAVHARRALREVERLRVARAAASRRRRGVRARRSRSSSLADISDARAGADRIGADSRGRRAMSLAWISVGGARRSPSR